MNLAYLRLSLYARNKSFSALLRNMSLTGLIVPEQGLVIINVLSTRYVGSFYFYNSNHLKFDSVICVSCPTSSLSLLLITLENEIGDIFVFDVALPDLCLQC